MINRRCTKPACSGAAVVTLTYNYQDSAIAVGPLSPQPEPGCYDLCQNHAQRLRAPQGWEITHLPGEQNLPMANQSDVMALADLIRRTGLGDAANPVSTLHPISRRKGHLAVLADPA